MSRQKGLIRLEGNLDGIAFYKSGGDYLARMANGPSKSKIQNDPAYVRTRENNQEFGGAATVGKAFRTAFAEMVRTMGDRYFSARLTQLFKKVCVGGTGARGQREISASLQPEVLLHVEFNKQRPFGSICNAPFMVSANADRNEVIVDTPNISSNVYVAAPSTATHFRITAAIGTLSDYSFDLSLHAYVPTSPDFNALGASVSSVSMALHGGLAPQPVNLVANFAGAPVIPVDVAVIVALGIDFYQRVNGVDYLLAQGNAMKVVTVL